MSSQTQREERGGGSARVLGARGVAAGAALAPPSELIYMLPAAPPVVAKATCPCPPLGSLCANSLGSPGKPRGWRNWMGPLGGDLEAGPAGRQLEGNT